MPGSSRRPTPPPQGPRGPPGRRWGRGQVAGFPPDTVPGEEGSKFGVGQSQVDVPRGSCPRGLLSCGPPPLCSLETLGSERKWGHGHCEFPKRTLGYTL